MRHLLIGLAAAVCSTALSAGCTATVAGTAQPARDSAGIIGIGRSIPQVLPTDAELSAVLKSRVEDNGFPPSVGGPGVLSRLITDGGTECVGVAYPFVRKPYDGAPVRAVATKDWSGIEARFEVRAGAVALASPGDARALFARFVGQWQHCRGNAVVVEHKPEEVGIPDYTNEITSVHTSEAMLTAVVMLSSSPQNSPPMPFERALGVAYNCIVDVEVNDSSWRLGDPPTTNHARDVAETMLAKAGGSG